MSVLNKAIVLKLNRDWVPVGITTPKHAFGEMSDTDQEGNYKLIAFDLQFNKTNEDYDYSYPEDVRLVKWDEWITLPVRDYDLSVTTGRGLQIRIPTVVIIPGYAKMPPDKEPADNINTYLRLYNNECQYTHKKLTRKTASIDHVIPRSRGGKDDPSNKVLAHVDFNNKKSNRLNSELGVKDPKILIPRKIKAFEWVAERERHPTWDYFLIKK